MKTAAQLTVVLCLALLAPAATIAVDDLEPVTLSVRDLDIREILGMFSRSRGVNIVTTGTVQGTVSLDLHEVPFAQALEAAVAAAGFQVTQRGDIYYVSQRQGAGGADILRDVRTFRLDYAQPDDVLPVLTSLLSSTGKATSYPPLRTVVVEDSPGALDHIAAVIAAIDVAPRQVLIEAKLIEVRMNHDFQLGIDWSAILSGGKGDITVEGFASPASAGGQGLFMTWGEGDFTAALQSLDSVESLETLASPRLLTIDGTEAEIIVGGQLGFAVTTAVENTVMQSIQFIDTGAQLRITPLITSDGYIMMHIHPELSDGVVQEGLPSKTTAEVTTDVLIKDGHTLLVGGLIKERKEEKRVGIPFLKNLPVIGMLFGRTEISNQKSELIALITPRIVGPESDEH